MSITAEDVRRRIAQASGGLTAEQVRARLAQAPGAAAPVPSVTNPTMEQVAASFSKPILETVEGVQDLMGRPAQGEATPQTMRTYDPRRGRLLLNTKRAMDWARENQAPGASGTGAEIAGEIAQMALPASMASKGARLLTRGRPLLGKVAPVTAESAAVGGMEGLKTPGEGETRLGNALTAAAANVAGAGAQTAVSRLARPQMFTRTDLAKKEAEELVKAGIKPDIPLSLGSEARGPVSNFTRWMQRQPLRAVPGFKKTLNRQVDKAIGDWREVMLKKALPEGADVPMPRARTGEAPVDATLDAIDDWYSKQYKEVLDPYSFDVMTDTSPVGRRLNEVITDIPGKGPQRTVGQKLGDLFGKYVEEGQLSGQNVSALKTALRREAKLAQDGVVKEAYYDAINALGEGVEEGIRAVNPEAAARYMALSGPYRNFITVDDAAGRMKMGEFGPEELFSAGQRKARSEKINPRRAPYREESQRAAQVYDINPKERESNIFQLGALAGVTGFGGVMAPGATAAIWAPVLASMPRRGQKYMMGELPYQQALSDILRKTGVQELSRAARIGGGQYLAE